MTQNQLLYINDVCKEVGLYIQSLNLGNGVGNLMITKDPFSFQEEVDSSRKKIESSVIVTTIFHKVK